MLTKEPEMLQTIRCVCEHRMQQTASAAGALLRTPLRELQRFPRSCSCFNESLRGFEGRRQPWKGGREGKERRCWLMLTIF